MKTLEDIPKTYRKAEALAKWEALEPDMKLRPCSIPYKHEGTTIAEDGIRICGSESFIFAVLSHLKPLLAFENGETRIGIAFSQIQDKETKRLIPCAFRCSVQVHERGEEAQHFNRLVEGMKARQAARRELAAQGLD
jgi:hypothetical protein